MNKAKVPELSYTIVLRFDSKRSVTFCDTTGMLCGFKTSLPAFLYTLILGLLSESSDRCRLSSCIISLTDTAGVINLHNEVFIHKKPHCFFNWINVF